MAQRRACRSRSRPPPSTRSAARRSRRPTSPASLVQGGRRSTSRCRLRRRVDEPRAARRGGARRLRPADHRSRTATTTSSRRSSKAPSASPTSGASPAPTPTSSVCESQAPRAAGVGRGPLRARGRADRRARRRRRRQAHRRRRTTSRATKACARRRSRRWPSSSPSRARTACTPRARRRRSPTARPRCSLTTAATAKELGLTPRARVVDQCLVGVDPVLMLTGPIDATRRLLDAHRPDDRRHRRGRDQRGVRVGRARVGARAASPTWTRVNPNGGAIALGHPVGATGARLHHDRAARARAHRRHSGADHDVLRRRARHRHDHRAASERAPDADARGPRTSRPRSRTTTSSAPTPRSRTRSSVTAPRGRSRRLHELGRRAGPPRASAWGFEANAHPPELRTHDRFGHRVDNVEYHPALPRADAAWRVEHGPARRARGPTTAPGAHVARAAKFIGLDPGRGRPRLPDLDDLLDRPRAAGRADAGRDVGAAAHLAATYDPRPVPADAEARRDRRHGDDREAGRLRRAGQHHRRGAVDGRGPGEQYRLTGHKWFCSAPMSDVFLMLAQAPAGLSCFVVPAAPRRRPQRDRDPAAQGQARQPLERVERDRARRARGPARRRGGPRASPRSSRWSTTPGSTACSARRRACAGGRAGDAPRRHRAAFGRRARSTSR